MPADATAAVGRRASGVDRAGNYPRCPRRREPRLLIAWGISVSAGGQAIVPATVGNRYRGDGATHADSPDLRGSP
jgi:hypothetical protein